MKSRSNCLKHILFSLSVGLFILPTSAQQDELNLVPNPSFEDASNGKIRRIGAIDRATGWTSATGERADLFSSESKTSDVRTPENIYGKEEPHTGINYAGIIIYSYREEENRTYLQVKLKSPLKKGMRYHVQFYASLAELSKYSANRLGAVLTRKPVGTEEDVPAIILEGGPSIEHPDKKLFDGMFGWNLVCGEYTANGREEYLTIGSFNNSVDINTIRNRKPRGIRGRQIIAAYYFIDDVSVRLLGPNETANCNYPSKINVDKTYTIYQRSPEITEEMSLNEKVAAHTVFYGYGLFDIRKNGKETIDKIVEILKANPSMSLQITGHCDDKEMSSDEHSGVAMKRAEFIRFALKQKGIDEDRIILSDGKNATPSPFIQSDDSEDLKNAKNRRVTFRVI